MAANFFKCVDGPLPIHWNPSTAPPKEHPMSSLGRPQKIQKPLQVAITSDSEQEDEPPMHSTQ